MNFRIKNNNALTPTPFKVTGIYREVRLLSSMFSSQNAP